MTSDDWAWVWGAGVLIYWWFFGGWIWRIGRKKRDDARGPRRDR